jgi:DNA replication protein DnaC
MNAALQTYLKELHLPTIRALYKSYATQAQQESLSYEQYLFELVEKECEERRTNRINRWGRESKLPLEKTLETFDRSRLPRKLNQQVNTLLKGDFLKNTENVLAFGNPGSGKTHLLAAIAQELIREGHRVYCRSCDLLVQDLLIAKQELRLSRFIKNLAKYEALLLDDIGYVQHNREEMEVLFTLLAERYERGSVMITSNLAFSQWERIFKDPITTAAVIDRLVHHSVILELNLPSYRMQLAEKNKKIKVEGNVTFPQERGNP